MRRFLTIAGILTFFAAWPAFFVYLRRMERTRILVLDGDNILVSKNWISDGKWSLPGGGIHKGEPIIQGAIREMYEETGVELKSAQLRFFAKCRYRAYGHRFDFYCFIVRAEKPWKFSKQLHEIAELKWMPISELNSHNAAPDTLIALKAWQNPEA